MVSCYYKIAAYKSEIKFDPNIPDLEYLAIVSLNKLFKLFVPFTMPYFVTYP
jgi:hypothetical protein